MPTIYNVPDGVVYEVTALVSHINDLAAGCKEKNEYIADLEGDLKDALETVDQLIKELTENT